MAYSTQHLDYLSRSFLDDFQGLYRDRLSKEQIASPPLTSVQLLRISEIGRTWQSKGPTQSDQDPTPYRSSDLLAGCFGLKLPVLFAILGDRSGVDIEIGTFRGTMNQDPSQSESAGVAALGSLLNAHYPGTHFDKFEANAFYKRVSQGVSAGPMGVLTGLPTPKTGDELDAPTQLDRVIRAMTGAGWGIIVLAEPLPGALIHDLEASAFNEMRHVENAEQGKPWIGSLADAYISRLRLLADELSLGAATGMWTTSFYYYADDHNLFDALGSILCSCFGGKNSLPDPIRAIELADPGPLRAGLGQILSSTPQSPGSFEYPYAFQTLLNSVRLSCLIHLPRFEASGFTVRDSRRFDVTPHQQPGEKTLSVGRILDRGRPLRQSYLLSVEALDKHAMVVGVTGSGKTNTLFHLLKQLWQEGIPFLVLEPAKKEYRTLLNDDVVGPDLQVFTLGDETASPLRINPFEVEPGVSISTHIDLLKATFNASFGMWTPLPQVLEQCIHAVYRDRGWDTVRGENHRLPVSDRLDAADRSKAFPTLGELARKAEEVVERLGYEERVTSDIKAALVTRINSLRIGGKGVMLDTSRSMPIERLLSKPTVIELEQIGDDDEKAFLMGLFLIRLYEHLRAHGSTEGTSLRHIVVFEEAHRLLANVPLWVSQEQSNIKGKAVEAFVNMLSEVRAYGQGFFVAEQIPTKLSTDILKNTNVKLVHRTVAGDDRQVLGQAMNMDEEQSRMMAVLRVGEAAVFAEGDDCPLLIKVPYAKVEASAEMATRSGSDRLVAERMRPLRDDPDLAPMFVPFPSCLETCRQPYAYCETAKKLIATRRFREHFNALVLTLVESPTAIGGAALRLETHLSSRLPPHLQLGEAIGCILNNAATSYLSTLGRRYSWPYTTVDQLASLLPAILFRTMRGKTPNDETESIERFQEVYRTACERGSDPFPACSWVCPSGHCLFRYHTEALLRDTAQTEIFDLGMAAAAREEGWSDLRAIDQAVARLGGKELPAPSQRSIALCYGIQQIFFKPDLLQAARELATDRLIQAYEHRARSSSSNTSHPEVET